MSRALDQLGLRALRNVAKNKKLAHNLVLDIRKRSERMAEDAHAIGTSLKQLSSPAMYQALGAKSFAELLKREKLMSKSQAYKLIAVAETYTKADLKKLDFEKAYALISYVEATPKDDLAVELFRANARIANSYISNMTAKSIEAAAKRVRRATGQNRGQSAPEKLARTTARKLQARLRKQDFKNARAVAVREGAVWRVQVTVDTADAGELA